MLDNIDDEILDDDMAEVEEIEDTDDNNDEYEKICYLCHRPESIAGKMIEMPQNMTVCTDCMQKTLDSMNSTNYDDLMKFSGMPGIHFMNLSDFGEMASAKKIKKKFLDGTLNDDEIFKILSVEEIENTLSIDYFKLRSYFPANYTRKQCEKALWSILDEWKENNCA